MSDETFLGVCPDWWDQARVELADADPQMALLIERYSQESLVSVRDPFGTLVRSIIGQQISTKAAENICERFAKACPQMTPLAVSRKHRKTLRATGLSDRKVDYILDICRFFLEENLTIEDFDRLEDSVIVEKLCSIKGVGPWTAQMFLIFTLGRPDVLPIADLGFLKAFGRIYFPDLDLKSVSAVERHDELLEITNRWAPWRTAATWYLWKSLNNGPVRY